MNASDLYKAGHLSPAIEALGLELRKQPGDIKRRTFLFELLCFAGEYDRAAKQLDVLASGSKDAESGAMLYRAALHAQRTREDMFMKNEQPVKDEAGSPSGICDGAYFEGLTDEDDRIGANLEVFIAGSYTWIPLRYIERVDIQAPTRLRDLLWAPAILHTTKAFRLQDLGEVLLPVMAPLSWKHPDDAVRLGRVSTWVEDATYEAVPVGQKVFLAGEEPISLLQIRSLHFDQLTDEQGETSSAELTPDDGI